MVPVGNNARGFPICDLLESSSQLDDPERRTQKTGERLLHIYRRYLLGRRAQVLELPVKALTSISCPMSSVRRKVADENPDSCLRPIPPSTLRHLTSRTHHETSISTNTASGQDSANRDAQQSKDPETPKYSHAERSPSEHDGKTNNRSRSGGSDEGSPPEDLNGSYRSFMPFGQPKSIQEVNEAIKAELQRPHPAAAGHIYGFTHPDQILVKLGTGPRIEMELVKIGRSENVGRRMQQWRKQCKYVPRLIFALAMPQHHRIERVVHHQLHNARLREHLGCFGCGIRHMEWFRVDAEHARSLVVMWQGYAERQPYDEVGGLLPDWIARLGQVDLGDPDCWSWFIPGPDRAQPVRTLLETPPSLEEANDHSSEAEAQSSDNGDIEGCM